MNNYMKVILSAVKTYIDKVAARFNNKVNEIDKKIPTKVSQLENDKVFITEEYVDNAITNANVQSDWNENDETSKAHVLNRTHYFNNIVEPSKLVKTPVGEMTLIKDLTGVSESFIKHFIPKYFSTKVGQIVDGESIYYHPYAALITDEIFEDGNFETYSTYIYNISNYTMIDDVNFYLTTYYDKDSNMGMAYFFVYNLDLLKDEWKEYFPVIGFYVHNFESYYLGCQVAFGNYIPLEDTYIPRTVLQTHKMDFSDSEKQIMRDNIGAVSSYDDLDGKPFYESTMISKQIIIEPTEYTFIKQFQGSEESGYQWIVRQSLSIDGSDYVGTFVDGEQINVLWNDTEYTAQVEVNGKGYPKLYLDIATISLPFEYSDTFDIIPVFNEYYDTLPDGMNVGDQVEVPVTFSIYRATNTSEIKQLNEKFIPDTIARTSDIVNSDWNENDETSKSHILNRTHYIDTVQAEVATVKNISNLTKVKFECKNEFYFANTSIVKVTIKGSDDSILYEKELTRQKLDYSQPGIGIVFSTGWFGNVNLCDDSSGLNDSNFPTDSDAPICVFGEEGRSGESIINPNIKFTNLSLRIDEALLSTTSDSYSVEIIDMDNTEIVYIPLDERFIPETIARKENIPVVDSELSLTSENSVQNKVVAKAINDITVYYNFPYDSVETNQNDEYKIFSRQYFVNLDDLETKKPYKLAPQDYPSLDGYIIGSIVTGYINCEDGTKAYTLLASSENDIVKIVKTYDTDTRKQWNLYTNIFDLNYYMYIDCSDRTSQSTIIAKPINNALYIKTGNNVEYIPTTDYSPATKKYVDDSVTNIDLSVYETTDNAQAKLEEAKSYADTSIANLVNSAPETLDTLGELAAAFEENHDMVETLNEAIAFKANQSDLDKFKSETWTFTLNDGTTVTKQMVVK